MMSKRNDTIHICLAEETGNRRSEHRRASCIDDRVNITKGRML
jgi:hypothetical protein